MTPGFLASAAHAAEVASCANFRPLPVREPPWRPLAFFFARSGEARGDRATLVSLMVPNAKVAKREAKTRLANSRELQNSCALERFASESSRAYRYLSVLACVPMLLGRNVLAKRAAARQI